MATTKPYDCIVIGAGPGGLVAAIYLQRLKRRVLLVDGGRPRAARIPKIRNLVGYTEGISGKTLVARLRAQLQKYGGTILHGCATVRQANRGFIVDLGGQELRAHKVILATGMKDYEPPLDNLEPLTQKGLLGYCPICDGFDHSGEKIALLVKDPAGLKKIGFMWGFSEDLMVVFVRDFKVPPKLVEEIKARRVKVYRQGLKAIREGKDKGLWLHFREHKPVYADSAYVMMGASVPDDAFSNLSGLARSDDGYLIVDDHQETSVPGVFAVGDCVKGLSQVSVAVGHAAVAATQVHNTLRR